MILRNLFLTVALAFTAIAASAQTDGFSYQAVVRDNKGELVSNKSVGLRLTIADSNGSKVMYSETQKARTNAYGVLSVTIGNGTPENGGKLSNVDWAGGQAWLHVGIDVDGGSNYVNLGATKIQAVPVALYAARSGSSAQSSEANNSTDSSDALFEVKDKEGNVVFAVYPGGVCVYVDESKAKRSGLIVTGRPATKDAEPQDYLVVNQNGTQVIVDPNETDKAKRSGLIVTGRPATKDAVPQDYLVVNNDGTQVIVDQNNTKAKRSGLIVTGRPATKEADPEDYLVVNPSGTHVIVDDELESDTKTPRSGFIVTGRPATKDGATTSEPKNYMKVATDGTKISFDESSAKAKRSGLVVTGRPATKDGATTDEEYFNIDLSTTAKILDSVNRIYWYPERNAFMAGNLKVEHPDSVGTNSFNAGYQNKAIGEYSQALGYKSVAKGDYTTAIGRKANAGAERAYALGDSAQAQGKGSYAFGSGAVATGVSSYAFGSVGIDSIAEDYAEEIEPAKAIGNYSYAIGAGTRALGTGSLAMGVGSKATGYHSVAIGYATAAGEGSFALSGKAIGSGSIVLGGYGEASGEYAISMGRNTEASGEYSVAMGWKTRASGKKSTSIGLQTKAIGDESVAMGYYTTATGEKSLTIGERTSALGKNSVAMGHGTTAYSHCEFVLGRFNTGYDGTAGTWKKAERLFVIGNGKTENAENGKKDTISSDALIIYKNGNAEFRGSVYPSGEDNIWAEQTEYNLGKSNNRWNTVYANTINVTNGEIQTSDQRLKTNIKPLEKALDKVLTLNGVTYEWRVKEFPNKNFDSKTHVGVLAQELEAVLPEAVEIGEDGYKSVNYSNITPLLIEAIKEQQTIIDNQQKQIDELRKMVEELLNK